MLTLLGEILTSRIIHNPVFIVGLGRSGTTVLLQAIGKHPDIFSIKGESPLIYHLGALLSSFEFSEYKDWHFRSLEFSREYLLKSIRHLCFESVYGPHMGLRKIVKHQLRGHMSLLRVKYWSARTYPDAEGSKGILLCFPNARFVYIFRNGIDVVQSRTRYKSFRDLSFTDHCREWARHVDKYAYMLDMKETLPIRQEDLSGCPEDVFQRICRFIGTEYDPQPVDYLKSTLVHPLDLSTKKGVDAGKMLKERPPAHENWSSENQNIFKNICGDAMIKLGYQIPF